MIMTLSLTCCVSAQVASDTQILHLHDGVTGSPIHLTYLLGPCKGPGTRSAERSYASFIILCISLGSWANDFNAQRLFRWGL